MEKDLDISSLSPNERKKKCFCFKSKECDTWKCKRCKRRLHLDCVKENDEGVCIECLIFEQNPLQEKIQNLINVEPSFLPVTPPNRRNVSFSFNLTEDLVNKLKNENMNSMLLYCYRMSKEQETIEWPDNIKLSVNGSIIKFEKQKPVNISNYIQSENNEVVINYTAINLDKYILLILPMRKKLLKDIHLKHHYSEEECRDKLSDLFKENNIKKEQVSIRCPYSQQIMKQPVRSKKCKHINCFDLDSYLKLNLKKYICPICRIKAYVSDLYEDVFLKKIFEEFYNSKKESIDEYDLFIYHNGKWREAKKETKMNNPSYIGFDDQVREEIERLNYSPERKSRSYDNANEKVYEQLFGIVNRIICSKSKDYVNDTYSDSEAQALINKLNPLYLSNFIKGLRRAPITLHYIFPSNTFKLYHESYYTICANIYKNYEPFFKILTIWKRSEYYIISLLIKMTTNFNEESVYQNNQNSHDIYFTMELILGLAHFVYVPNQLTTPLEVLIGRLFSIYFQLNKFKASDIAHILDLLTQIFPCFYLPNNSFSDESQKKIYFEKLLRFYSGIFINFKPEFTAEVFKLLFENISTPLRELHPHDIMLLQDVEENFISPLMNRLLYDTTKKAQFLQFYDTFGHFRSYLHLTNKLKNYGWQEKKNYNEVVYIDNIKSVAQKYELSETNEFPSPLTSTMNQFNRIKI